MEAQDPSKLRRDIKVALEHVRETGRLSPSDLQLPIFAAAPTCTQPLAGYEGGAFDPAALGAACIVVPTHAATSQVALHETSQGRAPLTRDSCSLEPVPTPSIFFVITLKPIVE